MTVQKCPVCESHKLFRFLERSQVPVHQNLVVRDRAAARSLTRGELELAVCEDCGFVFNQAFDFSRLAYGKDYDNTQSCSAYFDDYLDGLIKDLVEYRNVRNSMIVEVGCGKGQFLKKLVNYPGTCNRGYGFDPSYIGPDTDLDGRIVFRRCYYDDKCTDVPAEVVICRHVIEHVPEPLALLRSVRSALIHAPQAKVFFETPCVDWILRNQVIWDFFYEHCSLFSANSLRLAFERTGFSVTRVTHIFGGQYLWLEAKISDNSPIKSFSESETQKLAHVYGAGEEAMKVKWLSRLKNLRVFGKVALWGAGAKGATFANLIDPDCTLIDCVVDVNPNKQGKYLPGTGHAIVAPADISKRGISCAVLMNPNYRNEILDLLAKTGITLELTDWSE